MGDRCEVNEAPLNSVRPHSWSWLHVSFEALSQDYDTGFNGNVRGAIHSRRHSSPAFLLQGGLDQRVSGSIITASECTALLAAFVIVLSMLGVNVNALLLPAGIALAYAAKDLSHNFLAGRHPYAQPQLSCNPGHGPDKELFA